MTLLIIVFFFFNDTATTEIYTLSLHDALPICRYTEHDAHLASTDPLNFTDTKSCRDRLKQAEKSTGLKDALITGEGRLASKRVIICAMEFQFIGGSMGAVVGEKIARAIDRCIEQKLPLVVVSCSGGARMMEGAISLMQMAKVSA